MQANEMNAVQTDLLRPDLQESFTHSHIDPSHLSKFQRIILTTDGTLTEILEAYLLEKIQIIKLSEEIVATAKDILPLDLKIGSEVIYRKVLLQGKISRRNWIYAESIIVPERLDELFRERLLKSREPIGRLWLEHQLETFKEIIDSGRELVGDLSNYFKVPSEEKLLCRTYRVFSNRKPIMVITEKFPEQFFV
jgi:chorismate-pyruvate lyase